MTMLLSPSYFGAASAACARRDHPPPFLRSCAPIIRPDPTNTTKSGCRYQMLLLPLMGSLRKAVVRPLCVWLIFYVDSQPFMPQKTYEARLSTAHSSQQGLPIRDSSAPVDASLPRTCTPRCFKEREASKRA